MPSLTSLRAFEAVARNLSFTHAAEELCVTQSALSHQIRLLEESLCVPLFVRGPGGIIGLTDDSEELLAVTSNAFNRLEAVSAQIVKTAKARSVTLTIQAPPVFASYWLIPRLADFIQQSPNVEICIKTHPDGRQGADCDFVVDAVTGADTNSNQNPDEAFLSTPCVVLCSPTLLGQSETGAAEPLKETALLCYQSNDSWNVAAANGSVQNKLPSRRILFDNSGAIVSAGIAGQGLFLGSPLILDTLLKNGSLIAPFEEDIVLAEAYFLRPRKCGSRSRASGPFRDWLMHQSVNASLCG